MYEKDATLNATLHYIHTDYQGSWLAITRDKDAGGNVAIENRYSYDAWGRPRNPSTWQLMPVNIATALVDLSTMQPHFDRGYTGHEHMAGFGLINMNGRLYDPYLQRFLSPDPNVQSPGNSQSYNRYAYCLNNPLKYTDPSGYTWKIFRPFVQAAKRTFNTVATVVVDVAAITIGIPLAIVVTAATTVVGLGQLAFTGNSTILKNEFKIIGGLFTGSPGQILSRFTNELPQTIVGYVASQGSNMIGDVKSVSYYGGSTVVQHYSGDWGGFTIGSYINGDNSIEANPKNHLFQHEYGHYLQSQDAGRSYLTEIAIPNLRDASINDYWGHTRYWSEQDANKRALTYFLRSDKNYDGWDWYLNPIYNKDGDRIYDLKINEGGRRR